MAAVSAASLPYRCLSCVGGVCPRDEVTLECIACRRCYPMINGIPVLTLHPNALLISHYRALESAAADLDRKRQWQGKANNGFNEHGLVARARRMLNGTAQNLNLIQRYMRPLIEYCDACSEPLSGVAAFLSLNNGWSPQELLPYFYLDWAGTSDFKEVKDLIVGALAQFSPDFSALAVLGAGACGIVKAGAPAFCMTFGVDLSLPALLIAQGMLSGHEIEVHLQDAGWQAVRLSPLGPSEQNKIRLVAADVTHLPFANHSLSCVVTQYLMDIVANPLRVAEEIRRVLKPSGVWLNFSTPFRLPDEPFDLLPPDLEELPAIFEPMGWEIIKMERKRFNYLNFDEIHESADRRNHQVAYFVVRNDGSAPNKTSGLSGQADSSMWWESVPRLVHGLQVATIRKRVFGMSGPEDRLEIALNKRVFSVPEQYLAIVNMLFEQVDGKMTMQEIFTGLEARRILMTREDFYNLMHFLVDQYQVLKLSS